MSEKTDFSQMGDFNYNLNHPQITDYSPESLKLLERSAKRNMLLAVLGGATRRTIESPLEATSDTLDRLTTDPLFQLITVASGGMTIPFNMAKTILLAPMLGGASSYDTLNTHRKIWEQLVADHPELVTTAQPILKTAGINPGAIKVDLGGRLGRFVSRNSKFDEGGLSSEYFPTQLDDPYDNSKVTLFNGIGNTDNKAKTFKALAKLMEESNPDELSDVRVSLGGQNLGKDIYRILTNKRLGPIGTLLGLAGIPGRLLGTTISNRNRGDHYDAFTNTVNLYSDDPAVLTHELGHAIDINKKSAPVTRPSVHSWWNIPGKAIEYLYNRLANTKRDLYGLSYAYDPAPYEGNANRESGESLRKAFDTNKKVLSAIEALRRIELPRGYATYLRATGRGGPLVNDGLKYSVDELANMAEVVFDKHNKFKNKGVHELVSFLRNELNKHE